MQSFLARSLVVVASAGTLAGVAATPAAAAPTSCPVRASVPNVKLTGPAARKIPMKLTQTCNAWGALWLLRDATGAFDETQGAYGELMGGMITFPTDIMAEPTAPLRAGITQPLRIRDDVPLGTQTLLGFAAFAPSTDPANLDGISLPIASTTFRVKAGASAKITATRTGGRVTLGGKVTRYTPAANRYAGFRGAAVTMQWRPTNTSAWRNLTMVRTDATGAVPARTWGFSRPALFRFTVAENSGTWSTTSAQVGR
ncbi:hypothetical protein GCM10010123_44170 [Pilimelia anulata]|uniref:Uncharacterized protein n=1 Tax=Pilimelia anulata TaxID=53371 RepID=A0A8J3BBF5_9ACTN|nr:hypothetical protein [Pilimelia anulata]GGK09452.1 hypothetical protein GCM10010123_44170 [Pilimelia anulata]